jgi:UDP-N-acetylmuramyl pentapeptide phosphotransferase/UDP-N-acetylglucosamine-1-phosphate transferase
MSILLAAAAILISMLLTQRFCDPASRFHVLDQPNDRSLHTHPTPRSGGLAILSAVYLCGIASIYWLDRSPDFSYGWIGGASLLVAGVSYIDDRLTLPTGLRFIVHTLAAVLIALGGFVINHLEFPGLELSLPYWIGVIFTLLFVVWMLNLYNFMDGMDGFAGGMAVFGFGTFAVMGWTAGHDAFLAVSLIIAAASAGFLFFNFPPARIFMGDVGSSTLGLLAATLSLWGARDGIFPFWIAFLVFSPFIVDATVTLFRRLLRGDKIWQAHKTHFYQRLVQAGWGHRKTVLWEYVLMAACAGSAIWVVRQTETVQWWTIGFWAVVYALLIAMARRLEAGNLRTRKEDRRA